MISGTVQLKTQQISSNNLAKPLFVAFVLVASRLLPVPQNGQIDHLPSVCVFHLLTGLPCPGCGLTRSFVCFAHGNWQASLAYHPLGPVLFIALAIYAGCTLLGAIMPQLRLRISPSYLRYGSYAAITIVLAVWVFRLAGIFPMPYN